MKNVMIRGGLCAALAVSGGLVGAARGQPLTTSIVSFVRKMATTSSCGVPWMCSDLTCSTPPVSDAVTLAAGESKTVTMRVPVRDLSFVGRENKLVLEAGEFDLMVGPLTQRFRVR